MILFIAEKNKEIFQKHMNKLKTKSDQSKDLLKMKQTYFGELKMQNGFCFHSPKFYCMLLIWNRAYLNNYAYMNCADNTATQLGSMNL